MIARLLVIFFVHAVTGQNLASLGTRLTTLDSREAAHATSQNTRQTALEARLTTLESKQALHSAHCGYQDRRYSTGQVNYDSLLTDVGTVETGSSMNAASGTWTAGLSGTYLVMWTLVSAVDPRESNKMYLYKNGYRMEESEHQSYRDSNTYGQTQGQGGRSLVLRLAGGTTLGLKATSMNGVVYRVTFCVTLLKAD